ncbi:MAG: DNA-directed RNA polymerase subunit alpha [Candidatus Aenigmatarchaeota archaeon]
MIKELIFPESIKLVASEKNKAVFEISPLYPGYGVTIGNALRRVLLSSIKGTAITTVHIEGVLHEFSTIPGILEDVIDILLNLKQVRIKYFGEDPVEMVIEKAGEGEVFAGDIKAPAGVEVVNPELKICTITNKDTTFKATLIATRGYGYSPAEERTKERVEPGTIVLDAIFSPVVNVSYEVENIVYKGRADYNLLRLTIETDGSISPQEALLEASEILIKHFSLINEAFK